MDMLKVNGGRVAARVHIRPAEEEAINEYIKEVEKVIKRWHYKSLIIF